MGLLSVESGSLPNQFDIVWCLFPKARMEPSDVVRPTLVLDVLYNADEKAAALIVAYGTDNSISDSPFLDDGPDLIIETMAAARALGLHKPTRFSMWAQRRRLLSWSDEYFAPQSYRKNAGIIAGSLHADQVVRVKDCFRLRGLDPYWAV
jgi:hypothetical protein